MASNPFDNITITKKALISGSLAILIAGGLVACRDYHAQAPQLTDIGAAMLLVAAFAWRIPIGPEGTIITPTIRLVSQERITAAPAMDAPETALTTHTAATTVVMDAPVIAVPRPEQSSDHVAAAVQHAPRKPARIIPPTPPVA